MFLKKLYFHVSVHMQLYFESSFTFSFCFVGIFMIILVFCHLNSHMSLDWSHPQFIDGGSKRGVYLVLSSTTSSLSRCFQHGPPSVPTTCQACWGTERMKQNLVSNELSAGLNHFWGTVDTCEAGTQYMCEEQKGMPNTPWG